MKAVPLN